jgi:hypothetical protein
LTLLLLSSGVVLLASWLVSAREVAGLKVSLTIVTAGSYLLPVSIPVLQASWSDDGTAADAGRHRQALRFMAAIAGLACLITIGFVGFGDRARSLVLGVPPGSFRRFDPIFWSFPAYALIGPITAFLVATRRTSLLTIAFAGALAAVLLSALGGHLEWSVTVGGAAFVLTAGGLYAAAQAAHHEQAGLQNE